MPTGDGGVWLVITTSANAAGIGTLYTVNTNFAVPSRIARGMCIGITEKALRSWIG